MEDYRGVLVSLQAEVARAYIQLRLAQARLAIARSNQALQERSLQFASDRNQAGLVNLRPEWLDVRRGIHRERTDERGHPIGTATDETGMRGFWRHYQHLMTGGTTA